MKSTIPPPSKFARRVLFMLSYGWRVEQISLRQVIFSREDIGNRTYRLMPDGNWRPA